MGLAAPLIVNAALGIFIPVRAEVAPGRAIPCDFSAAVIMSLPTNDMSVTDWRRARAVATATAPILPASSAADLDAISYQLDFLVMSDAADQEPEMAAGPDTGNDAEKSKMASPYQYWALFVAAG